MATAKKYFDTRSKSSIKFPLKIAISHRSKNAYIPTGFQLFPEEWNASKQRVKTPYNEPGKANARINKQFAIVEEVIESLRPYFKQLDVFQIKEAAQKKIDEEFGQKIGTIAPSKYGALISGSISGSTCFFNYAQEIVKHYYMTDKGGSAKTIEGTIGSLKLFTKAKELPITNITEEFLTDYERWYIQQINRRGEKNTINGFGVRARAIRVIYNIAIRDKKTEVENGSNPFGQYGYSIKKEKTDNRNMDPSEIAKVFKLEIKPEAPLWHHLNFFLYGFECWGMNFADVAYLRVSQVQGGKLQYRRRKTRWAKSVKKFEITHSPLAQKIIDYYTKGKKSNDFVFPILTDIFYLKNTMSDKEEEAGRKELFENKFKNRRSNHIRRLKAISQKAGLKGNLSIYVGRHSFFSIALRNGVSKSEISEMAGHANFQITEAYLAGFSGEQLNSSAQTVRDAVSKHTNPTTPTDPLEAPINLIDDGSESSIRSFLQKAQSEVPTSDKDATQLVIQLLTKTSCQDGKVAQELVDRYLKVA